MAFDVDEAISVLRSARIRLARGLSAAEMRTIETRYGIRFGADHAALLRAAVPTGNGWPAWRSRRTAAVRSKMVAAVDGVLFDVASDVYWQEAWGTRPSPAQTAVEVARSHLASWPRPVPVYGHRFMTAGAPSRAPVLSIVQTDALVYGNDLLDYLHHEFTGRPPRMVDPRKNGVLPDDPWHALAIVSTWD